MERGEIFTALRRAGYPPGVAADVLADFRDTVARELAIETEQLRQQVTADRALLARMRDELTSHLTPKQEAK